MSRENLFTVFFFLVLALLLREAYRIFSYFLAPIAWAAMLALTFFPLYRQTLVRVRRPWLAALAMTLLVALLVTGPIATIGGVAVGQGQNLYRALQEKTQSGQARSWFESLQNYRIAQIVRRALPEELRERIDLGDLGMQGAQRGTEYLVAQLGVIAGNVVSFVIDFAMMLVVLFFFFRDGRGIYQSFRDLLPMETEHKDRIFGRLYETVSAVVQGMVVTAAMQGVTAGLAFWFLGLPFALFLGIASSVASFVPLGGAALVWIPAMAYLFAQGEWERGLFLLAWGVFVVSLLDNLLRPILIGNKAEVSAFLLLFGILGGAQAYGPVGIFVGPVLLATLVVVLRIYREHFANPEPSERVAEGQVD